MPLKFPKELRSGNIENSQLEKLREGDILQILKNEGDLFYMKLDSYEGETLKGTSWMVSKKKKQPTKSLMISLSDIEKLKVERVSTASTIGVITTLVIGFTSAIFLVALALDPIAIN